MLRLAVGALRLHSELMRRAKRQFSDDVRCPHCGNTAPMEIVASHTRHELVWNGVLQEQTTDTYVYELLSCSACRNIMLRSGYLGFRRPEILDYHVLYPPDTRELIGLPPAVRQGYEAAMRVRNVDPNAYAVLIGRVLELVCSDRGAQGRTLANRLDFLAKRGEIPQKLVGCVRHLKNFRNVGAHASLGELTRADLPILDDLVRSLLEYVYSAPELAARAEKKFAELTRQ